MGIKYTLNVLNLDTNLMVDVIHTGSISEPDAINEASQIVDTAKAKGLNLCVVIRRTLNKKRIGMVTPDEITLD